MIVDIENLEGEPLIFFFCLNTLETISQRYRLFSKEKEYCKGVYHLWCKEHRQDIKIATIVTHILINMKNGRALSPWVCDKCGELIMSKPKLHHLFYDWDDLYNWAYTEIYCTKCHNGVHNAKSTE